jgi:hypothetical protein
MYHCRICVMSTRVRTFWRFRNAEFIRVNTDIVRSSGIELGRTENILTARVFMRVSEIICSCKI